MNSKSLPDPNRPAVQVLIRKAEVQRRTGLSNSTLYAAIAAGTFPRQVHMLKRSAAWVEAEVDQWITDRISSR